MQINIHLNLQSIYNKKILSNKLIFTNEYIFLINNILSVLVLSVILINQHLL